MFIQYLDYIKNLNLPDSSFVCHMDNNCVCCFFLSLNCLPACGSSSSSLGGGRGLRLGGALP